MHCHIALDCPIVNISKYQVGIFISQSHISKVCKTSRHSVSQLERPGPIDRTPGIYIDQIIHYVFSELVLTHRKIEDEDVGCVSHGLVEQNDEDDKKIADEADHNDKGEEDGDDDGDDRHQGLQLLQVHFLLLPLVKLYCAIHLNNSTVKNFCNLLSYIFLETPQTWITPTEIIYLRNF